MAAYKDLVGQKITKVTSNPSEPKTGQMWYNSTNGKLRGLGILEAFSSASPLSTGRFNSGAGGTTSATWIAGGYEPSASNKTEEFNGTGFSSGGNLNTARGGNIGTGVQTAGLTMGGGPGSAPYTSAATEEYDGSSWTTISPGLNTERLYAGAGGTQTAGVVFAGSTTPNATVRSAATEEYNGSSWTTVSGGNVNSAQSHLGGCGTQTAALKAGGDDPGGSSNNSEEYNGSTWTTGNNLNTARRADGTSGIQTQALVVGGYAPPGAKSVVESYDGTSFTETADLATAQYYNTTSGNTNGTGILSMGGAAGPPAVSTVEEYNKSTNTITAAAFASGGNLNTARRAAAGFGTQNAAVVAGGNQTAPGYSGTANSEEYDGSSFTEGNNMNTPRANINSSGYGPQTAGNIVGGAAPSVGLTNYETYDGTDYSNGPTINTGRFGAAAVGTSTAGLMYGGYYEPGGTNGSTLSEEYNGSSWSEGNDLNTAGYDRMGFGTQTAAVAAGGVGTAAFASVEEYNGTSWTSVTSLANPQRLGGSVGTQTDGFIFGGFLGPSEAKTTLSQGYDGTSWSSRPSMATARLQLSPASAGTSVLTLGAGGNLANPTTNVTEEFTGETTAANITDFTTS
jgi:hypothetical protein